MNCEICKAKAAETAIRVEKDGEEDELYVCRDCAKAERVRRQKKSHRTRKGQDRQSGGISMTVTRIGPGGEPPPPVLEALLDAVSGFVGEIEQAAKGQAAANGSGDGESEDTNDAASAASAAPEPAAEEPVFSPLPLKGIDLRYRLGDRLHLEGLHLIGEIEAVARAADALGLRLSGADSCGVHDPGHSYLLEFSAGGGERAARIAEKIVEQERNARVRLMEEMPRVFDDAVCRALAVLKNCRLLSPGELYDLLSPLRLAAMEDLLEGVKTPEIESLMASIDLADGGSDRLQEDLDREDSERADAMNERFADVVLGGSAEGKLS